MDFDWRLLVVLLPLGVAGGWAVFNIGAVAITQAQKFLKKQS
jgi:photosystem II PsbY protein